MAVSVAANAGALSLDQVSALLAEEGPQGCVKILFADDDRWEAFLDSVASGRSDWLALAEQLRPETDAHASETLEMAFQEALPRNPSGVLAVVARGTISAQDACGMYGFGQIEDERPTAVVVGLVDMRITAVSAVTREDLRVVRDECLKQLHELRELLLKPQAAG
jgi:hypothetical protein